MLADLQHRHEAAVARLGALETEREMRLHLEERAGSLVEKEAEARARAEQLASEVTGLRRQIMVCTWVTALLAVGLLVAVGLAAWRW